jgi:hypothetical protein
MKINGLKTPTDTLTASVEVWNKYRHLIHRRDRLSLENRSQWRDQYLSKHQAISAYFWFTEYNRKFRGRDDKLDFYRLTTRPCFHSLSQVSISWKRHACIFNNEAYVPLPAALKSFFFGIYFCKKSCESWKTNLD